VKKLAPYDARLALSLRNQGMNPASPHCAETILLAPHCSLSTRSALCFFASVCCSSLGIGAFFALHGFWPILPFAGLEMVLLAVVLRLSMRRRFNTQTIRISEDRIDIELRETRHQQQIVFPRHWAQVKLHHAKLPWHPSRLSIQSHGRTCELGGFLTEEARCALAERLKGSIGRVNESPQLQQQDRNIKV
jgi:uncharacterized membrane protein